MDQTKNFDKNANASKLDPRLFIRERTFHQSNTKNNIGINITDNCKVGCRHCAPDCRTLSAEQTQKEQENINNLARFFRSSVAHSSNYKNAIISGGEPFQREEYISTIDDALSCANMQITIHTSADWAKSKEICILKLQKIKQLERVFISIDEYHQEKISFIYVENLISACHILDIQVVLCIRAWDGINDKFIDRAFECINAQLLEFCLFEIDFIKPIGRAAAILKSDEKIEKDQISDGWKFNSNPCHMCTRPVIDTDGHIYACCQASTNKGIPHLDLGDITNFSNHDLQEQIQSDPICDSIARCGPLYTLKSFSPI